MRLEKLKWFVKCVLAGIAAFFIFCFISFFYYNAGRHSGNPSGATDFVYDGNMFYCQMREGIGFGTMDADGFNNSYPGVTSDADVLVMGSSHMEAIQIPQDKNAVYLLNSYFDEASADLTAYNIGLSSHNFYCCAANLEDALSTYSPRYLVIEALDIPTSNYRAKSVLEGTVADIISHEGFLYDIQSVPFPKLVVQQAREYQSGKADQFSNGFDMLENALNSLHAEDIEQGPAVDNAGEEIDYNAALFEWIGALSAEYDASIIIVAHPVLILNEDGSVTASASNESSEEFSELCNKNGIIFIDMSQKFLENYEANFTFPHGFYNSHIGSGHLNAYGHQMIAEELFEAITKMHGEES